MNFRSLAADRGRGEDAHQPQNLARWERSVVPRYNHRLVADSELLRMTNPHQTFRDARSKAQWAKRHIYKLVDEYQTLCTPDLTRLVEEDDFEPGQRRIKAVRIKEFPPNIPLIIGDAVHNLRTAFDYIVVAITGLDRIALPVGKTRDDVPKAQHYRTIESTKPDLAKFIIDEIQPYHQGQFLLWELSELDRIDKHRLILRTSNQAHRL